MSGLYACRIGAVAVLFHGIVVKGIALAAPVTPFSTGGRSHVSLTRSNRRLSIDSTAEVTSWTPSSDSMRSSVSVEVGLSSKGMMERVSTQKAPLEQAANGEATVGNSMPTDPTECLRLLSLQKTGSLMRIEEATNQDVGNVTGNITGNATLHAAPTIPDHGVTLNPCQQLAENSKFHPMEHHVISTDDNTSVSIELPIHEEEVESKDKDLQNVKWLTLTFCGSFLLCIFCCFFITIGMRRMQDVDDIQDAYDKQARRQALEEEARILAEEKFGGAEAYVGRSGRHQQEARRSVQEQARKSALQQQLRRSVQEQQQIRPSDAQEEAARDGTQGDAEKAQSKSESPAEGAVVEASVVSTAPAASEADAEAKVQPSD